MPKTLYFTASCPLPDDDFAAASEMLRVKPLWDELVAGLGEGATTTLELIQTPTQRRRRRRKLRQQASVESATAALLDPTAFDAEIAA